MKNFNDLLKNIDPKTLEEGRKKAEAFSKTAEGKALIDKLGGGSKVNLDNLKNITQADTQSIMSFVSQNPDLAKKIESILKKE